MHLKSTGIKSAVFVKIDAQLSYQVTAILDPAFLDQSGKFAAEDPVEQVVFVFKMIIETFAIQAAYLADASHADLAERNLQQKFF